MVKKVFIIVLLVLANLVLFALAFILDVVFIERLIRSTVHHVDIGILVLIIGTLAYGLYLVIGRNNKMKAISFGLFILSWKIVTYSIYYVNAKLGREDHFETFNLRGIEENGDRISLNIDFDQWYHQTQVQQDKNLMVDSVEVRIDNGLFGMQVFSDEVHIIEQKNCEPYTGPAEDSDHWQLYNNEADYYRFRRCFSKAISVYSDSIQKNPLEESFYYKRGELYLVKHQYKKALDDFSRGAILLYGTLGEKKVEELEHMNAEEQTQMLLQKLDNKEEGGILNSIGNLMNSARLKDYGRKILFCKEQLE